MADQTGVTLISSSDTPEQVQEALHGPAETAPPPGGTTVTDTSIPLRADAISVATPPAAEPAAESETPAEEPETETPTPPVEKHRSNDPAKRIAQITREKHDALRAREAAETRAAQVEREFAEWRVRMEAQQAPPAPVAPAPTPAASVDETAGPQLDQYDTYDQWKTASDTFQRAQIATVVRQQAAEEVQRIFAAERERVARAEAARADQEVFATHQKRLEDSKTRHADFDEVMAQAKDLPTNPSMDDVILRRSKQGAELMYYFGTHPDECTRIAQLSPEDTRFEMGRLEAVLNAGTTAAPGPVASAPRITSAPPVIRPVTGSTHASSADDDTLPMREWIQRQNARDRAAGRL